MSTDHFVVIGGGQAASQAVASMRQAGFEGQITVVCGETDYPYQRPPLSKAFLKGELDKERLYFRPKEYYEKQNVEVLLSVLALSIDRASQTVELSNGNTITYSKLLIATGAPPRKLTTEYDHLQNIHYLRTIKDTEKLAPILEMKERLVVIGAGYIGLEVAAVAKSAGIEVTVLEMAGRVLARVASPPVSEFFEKMHREAGVSIRTNAAMASLEVDGDKVSAVKFADGSKIECGAVLVGIGAQPAIQIAIDAGLDVDNGILVDEGARTTDPNIWAAGDCTNFFSERYSRRMRLESVPNAIEQAKVAASNMAGKALSYNAVPWFWSDQYDVKLQTVGLMERYDRLVIRGDKESRSFSVWYFKDNQLLAVDALNDAPAFMVAKKLLQTSNTKLTPENAGNSEFDLKSLF